MTNSKRVPGAGLKPFQKGEDPRRGKNGTMCAERAAWATNFNNALAKKLPPDEAADILIKAFKARQSWAVQEVLERLIGKVTQPVSGELSHTLKFDFGTNGNGNGNDE